MVPVLIRSSRVRIDRGGKGNHRDGEGGGVGITVSDKLSVFRISLPPPHVGWV